MKKILLLAVLALCAVAMQAQKVLEVTEVPNTLGSAYMNQPGEYRARVDIKCPTSIPLEFETQCDKVEDMRISSEDDGATTTYTMYLNVDPSVREYSTRVLTIASPSYDDVYYSMAFLKSGQWVTLSVSDPNATVDTGCYNEHHNKAMQEIKNMNYAEARRQLTMAGTCAEADQQENDYNIALVDSLMLYRIQADNALKLLDYRTASHYYEKMIGLNSYDSYAMEQNTRCISNFKSECDVLFNRAEWLYNERDYNKAKEIYNQVIARQCAYESQANSRLQSIESNARSRKNHSHVLTYEWRKDVPIGLHIGKYNMHKAGGFFQLDFNPAIFDAIRGECKYEDPATTSPKYPEFNVAFGWTIKIKNPVWVHVGPGFTGKFYYGKYKDKNFPYYDKNDAYPLEDDSEEANKHFNFGYAVSPVVGLTIKYSYFAIRCTYQYRFTIKKGLQEFMEPHRVSVGVGVAF